MLVIIPRGIDNEPAIDLVMKLITRQLVILNETTEDNFDVKSIVTNPNLYILAPRPQVRYMNTIIRNKLTSRVDFAFFTERLSCLIIEFALSLLPFKERKVITPTGCEYLGKEHLEEVF
jgi:uridine kinase